MRDEPPHVLVVGARRRGNRQEAADRCIRRIAATLAANAAVQVVITRRAVRVIVAESGSTVSSVMRITSFRIFRQRSGEFSYFARGLHLPGQARSVNIKAIFATKREHGYSDYRVSLLGFVGCAVIRGARRVGDVHPTSVHALIVRSAPGEHK